MVWCLLVARSFAAGQPTTDVTTVTFETIQVDLPEAPEPSAKTPTGSPAFLVEGEAPVVTVPAEALGIRGMIAFWFRLPEELRYGDASYQLLESDALSVVARERDSFTQLVLTFGKAMTREVRSQPRIQGLLTHLKADRWYHAAFTWDTETRENHFYLDGLDQGTPEPRAPEGVITGVIEDVELAVGSQGVTVGLPVFAKAKPDASVEMLKGLHRALGIEPYETEGVDYTGETLSSEDIEDKELIYSTDFEDDAELDDWVREGGESATIVDGRLRLQTGPSPDEGQHIVFWMKPELPPDFLAEWQFRPYDKENGLTIVFLNARGRNGESILDPDLSERDGTFTQYTKGDLDSYHISYYAGHRGSVNLRKNHGFYLTAIGREYVHNAPPETFHTITLLKQGGKIRLAVDGKVSLKYDDDGATYGPIHDHSGWFGLRQMYQAWYTEYDDLKVWALGE